MCALLLAIESSCDDTSAAVCRDGVILSNVVATQQLHSEYGGVVPELASRAHQEKIVPVVAEALKCAAVDKKELDAVAFTIGPGLIGSLLVGTMFSKAFALALDIPLITVNHMMAHVSAHFIDAPLPQFPFLCLTVSGGHTQIVLVKDFLEMEVIGETIDDAAGEAFDKIAKMLGLPYPGGPLLDKLAREGNPQAFRFPEPQVRDLNFSFSGLKTSVLYFLQKQPEGFISEHLSDLCASVQKTIVDILLKKLHKAAKQYGIRQIAIAGGVSANSELRRRVQEMGAAHQWSVYIPQFQYCTDNAAMIAICAYHKYLKKDFADHSIVPKARYPIASISQK
ncbi:MAG: tRNA (adenosine(37)-N6)-threonylcarbamoyltransferase complex transferase subunit TsaD [Sphingobacteriales bacterium]|nr:tRNA (adenosine(37)-N6)-threonylcarbamoyltransferase complex transferase subunit TsaD [Sphingobacteriales bacterium]